MWECGSDTVIQIQCLDKDTYWLKSSIFLVGTKEEKMRVFKKKIMGKYPEIYTSFRKVYYVC